MTSLAIYQSVLYELDKTEAPSFLLDDFNYFFKKATSQYCKEHYKAFDAKQQLTDDIGVISTSRKYLLNEISNSTSALPINYFHLLNCIIEFQVLTPFSCYEKGDIIETGCKRLTADMYPAILDDYYRKPKFKNPFYYIRDNKIEIRFGKNEKIKLYSISIDYLKTFKIVELTQLQLQKFKETKVDTSEELEFSDAVCEEIANRVAFLFMNKTEDTRQASFYQANQINPVIIPQLPYN